MKNRQVRRIRSTVTAVLGLLATAMPAYFQPAVAETAREACTHDAFRLCSDTMPDVARTKACLAKNRPSLSPLCKTAFAGGGSHARHRRRR
jgi:hypothetical protein